VDMDLLKLTDALALVAQGGLVAVAVAFILERVAWFQKLNPNRRFWLVFAVFAIVPVLAQAVLTGVPAAYLAAADPFWRSLVLGLGAWSASQFVHKWDKGVTLEQKLDSDLLTPEPPNHDLA